MVAVNFLNSSSNPYQAFSAAPAKAAPVAAPATPQSVAAVTPAKTGDRVTISQAARDALAAAQAKANRPSPVEAKLVEIETKSPAIRTEADVDYVKLHAPRLAESMAKEQAASAR
jgi:hypothetical protein